MLYKFTHESSIIEIRSTTTQCVITSKKTQEITAYIYEMFAWGWWRNKYKFDVFNLSGANSDFKLGFLG